MPNNNILIALALSALAGLATTVGSVIGIFVRKPGPRFLSFTLGFSAGVMILVSFVELLPKGINNLGFLWGLVAFFAGMGSMFLIDVLVPHSYKAEQSGNHSTEQAKLKRTGLLVALGIGIHNFPEGLVVWVPVYAATGFRKKAFWWSWLSSCF